MRTGRPTTQVGPGAAEPAIQMATNPPRTMLSAGQLPLPISTSMCGCTRRRTRLPSARLLTVRNDGKIAAGSYSASNLFFAQLGADSHWRAKMFRFRLPRSIPTPTTPASSRGCRSPRATARPRQEPPARRHLLGLIALSAQPASRHRNSGRHGASLGLGRDQRAVYRPARLWQRSLVPGFERSGHTGGRRPALRLKSAAHKLRLTGAHFRMRLTVEFPSGQQPTIALVNGHPAASQRDKRQRNGTRRTRNRDRQRGPCDAWFRDTQPLRRHPQGPRRHTPHCLDAA